MEKLQAQRREQTMNTIRLENINKCFGNGFCLNNVSFEIKGGEIFAFIGSNGAGKSTTIRVMLGLMEANSGKVNITNGGKPFHPKRVGLVLEDETPFEKLTPMEYLDFFASYYSVENKEERIIELLKKSSLYEQRHRKMKHFSKGMKRQLTILKAMIHNPDIIVMDEPFNGLAPEVRKTIKDLLRDYVKNGKIVFLSTHNLDEAENFCSSFGIMKKGEFLGHWKVNEIETSLEEFYFKKTKEQIS